MGETSSKTASFKKRELQSEALRSRLEGDLFTARQKLEDLVETCCEALSATSADELYTRLLENTPKDADTDVRLEVAFLLDALGNVLRGIEQEKRAPPLDEGAPETPKVQQEASSNELEALKRIEQGLALRKAVQATDPSNERLKIILARSYSSLSMYYHGRHMQEQADKAHLEALNLFADVPLTSTARSPKPPSPASGDANGREKLSPIGSKSPGEGHETTDNEPGGGAAALEEAIKQSLAWEEFRKRRLKELQAKVKSHILRAHQNLRKGEANGSGGIYNGIDGGIAGTGGPELVSIAQGVQRVIAQSQRNQILRSEKKPEKRCRLVLLQRIAPTHTIKATHPGLGTVYPLHMTGDGDAATQARDKAGIMDGSDEHIPEVIELDPDDQELVHVGRQSYGDALNFFQSRLETTRRRIGFIRLDSTQHDRLISRRHAQLKYSKVHKLMATVLGHLDNSEADGDEENHIMNQDGEEPDTAVAGDESGAFRTSMSAASEEITNANRAKSLTEERRRRMEADELAWVIRDLDSTNGILVNGVRVQEYPLRHGDIVSFGGATSVPFGCAVLTHKRRPVSSVFVYRFEMLDTSSMSYNTLTGDWKPIPSSEPSQLDPLVEVFMQEKARLRDDGAPGPSDMESFYFFVLYICAHPETLPEDDAQIRTQLVKSVHDAAKLHRKAVDNEIPFSHWASWIRSQALARS
mmetsp:Transcript_12732/g.24698  ORF Transcript_12732/g.24698 Transcript_12732/m.24698 type:complete len:699 (-) Transcript_12732:239-2335(-)